MAEVARLPNRLPEPPEHLSDDSKRLWDELVGEYDFDAPRLAVLKLLCESLDRCEAARRVLDAEGTTYIDRFNAPRARPEIAVERDSKIAVARLLRELGLEEGEPAHSPLALHPRRRNQG